MVEVIKYGPEVQKEIICSKCKSQLRFLNSDIQSMEDICPWDNDHGYWLNISSVLPVEKKLLFGRGAINHDQ